MRLRGSKGPYPYHEGKHLIIVAQLRAYADDSGSHTDSEYCLLLGYVASPRQWLAFERGWRAVLAPAGISEFHAKDFFPKNARESDHSPYRGWTDTKAHQFLDGLLDVILQGRIVPIGGAVKVSDFKTLSEEDRQHLTGKRVGTRVRVTEAGEARITEHFLSTGSPNKPYFVSLFGLVADALKASVSAHNAKVHFILDRQGILEAHAVQMFHEIIKYELSRNPHEKKTGDRGR